MKLTEPPKTICLNCKWYSKAPDAIRRTYDSPWDHRCDAPEVRKPVTYNAVTGAPEEPEATYCHFVNDGNCRHFVKRGLAWLQGNVGECK